MLLLAWAVFLVQYAVFVASEMVPTYHQLFQLSDLKPSPIDNSRSLRKKKTFMKTYALTVRFYQNWGGGSLSGYQEPVSNPKVYVDGAELPLTVGFRYNASDIRTYSGGAGPGFDQYAQYLNADLRRNDGAVLEVTGPFQNVSYISATVYKTLFAVNNETMQFFGIGNQLEAFDYEFKVDGPSNPYIMGNPSVFSYDPPPPSLPQPLPDPESVSAARKITTFQNSDIFSLPLQMQYSASIGSVPVYRLDKFTSQVILADDIAADGCTRAYLFAEPNTTELQILILRIKLPSTFIDDNTPDSTFGDYQTRYFSVSAHRSNFTVDKHTISYWGVNARMMKPLADADGYVYVFFTPDSFSQDLATKQGCAPGIPPILSWGRYSGYVLGSPSYSIIIRYRAPQKAWNGSPENAVCYSSPRTLMPLHPGELAEFTPEIYGGSLEAFTEKGQIGPIYNKQPWPSNSFRPSRNLRRQR